MLQSFWQQKAGPTCQTSCHDDCHERHTACAACQPPNLPRPAVVPRLGDASHLPRRLSDIETDGQAARRLLQSGASASLNPDLACQGCPTTDTRVQVRPRS